MMTARRLTTNLACLTAGMVLTAPGLAAAPAPPGLSARLQVRGLHQPAATVAPVPAKMVTTDLRAMAMQRWLMAQLEQSRSASHTGGELGKGGVGHSRVSGSNRSPLASGLRSQRIGRKAARLSLIADSST